MKDESLDGLAGRMNCLSFSAQKMIPKFFFAFCYLLRGLNLALYLVLISTS